MSADQLDLFGSIRPEPVPVARPKHPEPDPAALTDPALIAALRNATLLTAPGLPAEAARRRLLPGPGGSASAAETLPGEAPSAKIIETVLPFADHDAVVMLQRVGRTKPISPQSLRRQSTSSGAACDARRSAAPPLCRSQHRAGSDRSRFVGVAPGDSK